MDRSANVEDMATLSPRLKVKIFKSQFTREEFDDSPLLNLEGLYDRVFSITPEVLKYTQESS